MKRRVIHSKKRSLGGITSHTSFADGVLSKSTYFLSQEEKFPASTTGFFYFFLFECKIDVFLEKKSKEMNEKENQTPRRWFKLAELKVNN